MAFYRTPHRLPLSWVLAAAAAVAALAACRRSAQVRTERDAGSALAGARDVLCIEQPDGCMYCVDRKGEATFIEAEQQRPMLCDPKDEESCVEFCSTLTPTCALAWAQGPSCVLDDDLAFRRALFQRDAADRPESWLVGRVLDDGSGRIEGAHIRLFVGRAGGITSLADEASGKDGLFHLRLHAGPWSYALRISHPGRASEIVDRLPVERPDRGSATSALPRVFRMGPEHLIRGRVLDTASGVPVAAAQVRAMRTAEDAIEAAEARTADDGWFVLGGLEARRYVLQVTKFGWRATTERIPVSAPATRVTVKLARANVIRGVVNDAQGEPEPNATVAAVLSGIPGTAALPYTTWTSDADGRFAVDHFAAGTYYLWARRGDMLAYPPQKIELDQNQEVEVVLELKHKGARVTGRVRARHGLRLGAASRAVLLGRSPLAFPRPAAGEIDGTGRFAITAVLPGRYEISVLDGARTFGVVEGPSELEVPIEPASVVVLKDTVVVRPQISE